LVSFFGFLAAAEASISRVSFSFLEGLAVAAVKLAGVLCFSGTDTFFVGVYLGGSFFSMGTFSTPNILKIS
jgi:hypothetical protein